MDAAPAFSFDPVVDARKGTNDAARLVCKVFTISFLAALGMRTLYCTRIHHGLLSSSRSLLRHSHNREDAAVSLKRRHRVR